MAVAEKTTAVETAPRNPRQVLMVHGALGALYLLASLWLVFLGLPTLWRLLNLSGVFNEFLAEALLFLVCIPTVFGLFVLGRMLEGPAPVRGMRACAFYLSACAIVFGLIATSGNELWSVIGLVLLCGSVVLYFQPGILDRLVRCEAQGWFHAAVYKGNQGLRVRRCTVVGLMVIAICGIVTLINHGTLRTGANWLIARPFVANEWAPAVDPWVVSVPFGTGKLLFMYRISLTIPLLIFVASLWFSWRLVNWPTFADFLIATEAEMNKVSWTTRKRLYQDTIVVLTTVVLMTVFLFVIDILWIWILNSRLVDVLKHDPQAARIKNQSGAQW